MKKNITGITSGLIAACIAGNANADNFASAEVLPNNKDVTTDIKAGFDAGPKDSFANVGYFLRNRTATNYGGKTTQFTLNELSIGELAGLRLFGDARFSDLDFYAQAGVLYSHDFDKLGISAEVSSSIKQTPLAEFAVNLSYSPGNIRLNLEHMSWINKESQSNATLFHAGYSIKDVLELGPAAEFYYGKNQLPVQKFGGYLKFKH